VPNEEQVRERRETREDIQRLTENVNMLRQANAAQDVVNATMQANVEKLTDAVTGLTSTIDKSRGALYVISGVSGVGGAVFAWLAHTFLHKGGS
jgi:N-acetylmuramic acid 6-phosphate (MurNAc-6-P) etherase